MKDHERKQWIIRARQRISLLEQDNAILRKKLDEDRVRHPEPATDPATAPQHPIYDELRQLAGQSEFVMHCVTLHYSPDAYAAMADALRQIHFAVLDKAADMDGQERSDMKESIAQFMDDAVRMRHFIEVLRQREMKRKGKPSSED